MPSLKSGVRTTLSKGRKKLQVSWASSSGGQGTVSVRQGASATSHSVPVSLSLDPKSDNSLTNNTDATVNYTLS